MAGTVGDAVVERRQLTAQQACSKELECGKTSKRERERVGATVGDVVVIAEGESSSGRYVSPI